MLSISLQGRCLLLCIALLGCMSCDSGRTRAEGNAASVTVFENEAGARIENPTDQQIQEQLALLTLPSFAILWRSEMTYLQVYGSVSEGFQMEHQRGSLDEHFHTDRRDLSLDEIVSAFVEYRDETIDWDRYGRWSRTKLRK